MTLFNRYNNAKLTTRLKNKTFRIYILFRRVLFFTRSIDKVPQKHDTAQTCSVNKILARHFH